MTIISGDIFHKTIDGKLAEGSYEYKIISTVSNSDGTYTVNMKSTT